MHSFVKELPGNSYNENLITNVEILFSPVLIRLLNHLLLGLYNLVSYLYLDILEL